MTIHAKNKDIQKILKVLKDNEYNLKMYAEELYYYLHAFYLKIRNDRAKMKLEIDKGMKAHTNYKLLK